MELKRNHLYLLKSDPNLRLIFWRQAHDRDLGRTLLYFVVAPKPNETVGEVKDAWIVPDLLLKNSKPHLP